MVKQSRVVAIVVAVILGVVLVKSFIGSDATIALHNDGTEIVSITSCTSEPITLEAGQRDKLTVASGKSAIGCDASISNKYIGCLVVATKKESSTEVELSSIDRQKSQADCQSL